LELKALRQERDENPSETAKSKILSVDDDFGSRTIVKKFLENLFEIDDVSDGIAAIQKAKKNVV